MNYELAKKLKDAGYPIKYKRFHDYEWRWGEDCCYHAYCKLCDYKNTVYSKIAPGSDILFELDGCEKAPESFESPILLELIEECGDDFVSLTKGMFQNQWVCLGNGVQVGGKNNIEAVANLWLALNKK